MDLETLPRSPPAAHGCQRLLGLTQQSSSRGERLVMVLAAGRAFRVLHGP
jgi:hypothetical protein